MQAVVFHGIGDIRLENVPEPRIQDSTDAIVRLTASAICGTDLHMIRGTLPGMEPGTILGHEGVGVIEELGEDVRNLRVGNRVVIPSTIGCGSCVYCRSGYFSQCDNANPNGRHAGTAFFGGPASSGPFDGLQAEYARVPYAHVGLLKLPDEVSDDQAILLSDIFPTGFFGARLAEIVPGDIVAVFGCGPVGQFAITSARLEGAARIVAIDGIPSRLEMARAQGAETINFNEEDPTEVIQRLTEKSGVDRVIDAVGVDAEAPQSGPAAPDPQSAGARRHAGDRKQVAPETTPDGDLWQPGNAPTQALEWAVQGVAKAGTIAVIGVYPESARSFPLGIAMNKNLTVNMGNCNHRKYLPHLLDLVRTGAVDPLEILTQREPLANVLDAYRAFDTRQPGWIKVELKPATEPALAR